MAVLFWFADLDRGLNQGILRCAPQANPAPLLTPPTSFLGCVCSFLFWDLPRQLSVFRPGPRHPSVPGLYLTGASARPGNGVPLVLLGAKQTAGAILRDQEVVT